ncbi:hypothetical protein, partial [Escherichia coli]|uniref:hypothetical protein n=1 Tax=Escherichia coli TaxID=562 RepID=UPI001BC86BD8
TSFPNKTPAISKLELVLDIYPSLSLILRYIYCLVFQGASSKGHTHTTQDVIIGYTRIKICNPVDICPPPVKEENNP